MRTNVLICVALFALVLPVDAQRQRFRTTDAIPAMKNPEAMATVPVSLSVLQSLLERIDELEAKVNDIEQYNRDQAFIFESLSGRVGLVIIDIANLLAESEWHDHRIIQLEQASVPFWILEQAKEYADSLQPAAAKAAEVLTHFTRVDNDIYITDANLHIVSGNLHVVNGTRSTTTANGMGNVIIGYNEERLDGTDNRTGSHMLVGGKENNFTGYGGIVMGQNNDNRAPFSSIMGGDYNATEGPKSFIASGRSNLTTGSMSAIMAGTANVTSGTYSSVIGGRDNWTTNLKATVVGGEHNRATGFNSTVVGGHSNEARGDYSTVSGGFQRVAAGIYDWVAGLLFQDG